MTDAQAQNIISEGRQIATDFAAIINRFNAFNSRVAAVDAGNTIPAEAFKGANEGITKEQFNNFIALTGGVLKGLPDGASTVLYEIVY